MFLCPFFINGQYVIACLTSCHTYCVCLKRFQRLKPVGIFLQVSKYAHETPFVLTQGIFLHNIPLGHPISHEKPLNGLLPQLIPRVSNVLSIESSHVFVNHAPNTSTFFAITEYLQPTPMVSKSTVRTAANYFRCTRV